MLILLSIDTICVLGFAIKNCINKGKIVINHVFCVSLGYI